MFLSLINLSKENFERLWATFSQYTEGEPSNEDKDFALYITGEVEAAWEGNRIEIDEYDMWKDFRLCTGFSPFNDNALVFCRKQLERMQLWERYNDNGQRRERLKQHSENLPTLSPMLLHNYRKYIACAVNNEANKLSENQNLVIEVWSEQYMKMIGHNQQTQFELTKLLYFCEFNLMCSRILYPRILDARIQSLDRCIDGPADYDDLLLKETWLVLFKRTNKEFTIENLIKFCKSI